MVFHPSRVEGWVGGTPADCLGAEANGTKRREKKLRDMCGLIQVPSDAPIPHCAQCYKKSVVRPVCLFSGAGSTCCNTRSALKKRFLCSFWRTCLQASIVFPAGTSLYGKCAERRGRAPAVLSTEEDDRSSIVSLHFLRWRARRLMLHRAFCASAAAGAVCSLALPSCLVLLLR